jgi:hypothetical protein
MSYFWGYITWEFCFFSGFGTLWPGFGTNYFRFTLHHMKRSAREDAFWGLSVSISVCFHPEGTWTLQMLSIFYCLTVYHAECWSHIFFAHCDPKWTGFPNEHRWSYRNRESTSCESIEAVSVVIFQMSDTHLAQWVYRSLSVGAVLPPLQPSWHSMFDDDWLGADSSFCQTSTSNFSPVM